MSARRHGWSFAQAVSLFWLAACAASGPGTGASSGAADRSIPEWIEHPPARCAVGSSGPTLNPRNAIRHARISAIEALAGDSLSVDVQTISGEGPDGTFEIAAQALSGTLADARVVAVWADVSTDKGSSRRIRQVYSLACWPDASMRGLPDPDYPSWLLDPPASSGRICATGIAGPTWNPDDQSRSALADARLAIAIAIESRIEKRIFDNGRGAAKIARQVEPSTSALSRAETARELDREWMDEAGTGPIGLPGVLYGLACIED